MQATIDMQRLSGHVGARAGGQKQDCASHIIDRTKTLEGDLGSKFLPLLL